MNRKIALSALSALTALGLMGAATFAYFSDAGASNNNIFASGTLNLKLSDDSPETDQDTVSASFSGSNLAPGGCTTTQQLRVKNSGTVAADHIEIAAANTVTDVEPTAAPQKIDSYLRFGVFNYNGSPITIPNASANGNAFQDLKDLADNDVDNLALTDLNTNHNIDVQICLDSSAPNEVQGDSVDSDWTITLNQNSSQ